MYRKGKGYMKVTETKRTVDDAGTIKIDGLEPTDKDISGHICDQLP